ncbi:MAG: hypothetical protein EZS28_050823, partial [Streblomastix strix]
FTEILNELQKETREIDDEYNFQECGIEKAINQDGQFDLDKAYYAIIRQEIVNNDDKNEYQQRYIEYMNRLNYLRQIGSIFDSEQSLNGDEQYVSISDPPSLSIISCLNLIRTPTIKNQQTNEQKQSDDGFDDDVEQQEQSIGSSHGHSSSKQDVYEDNRDPKSTFRMKKKRTQLHPGVPITRILIEHALVQAALQSLERFSLNLPSFFSHLMPYLPPQIQAAVESSQTIKETNPPKVPPAGVIHGEEIASAPLALLPIKQTLAVSSSTSDVRSELLISPYAGLILTPFRKRYSAKSSHWQNVETQSTYHPDESSNQQQNDYQKNQIKMIDDKNEHSQ